MHEVPTPPRYSSLHSRYSVSIPAHTYPSAHLQKRLFVKPFVNPNDPVEMNLVLHQAIDDVVSDRFPVSVSEAVYLAALRAQVVLGTVSEQSNLVDYTYADHTSVPVHTSLNTQDTN